MEEENIFLAIPIGFLLILFFLFIGIPIMNWVYDYGGLGLGHLLFPENNLTNPMYMTTGFDIIKMLS